MPCESGASSNLCAIGEIMLCPWLLDRPVKPGDDGNGMQALETEHQRIALVTASARLGSNVNWSQT
jgi:hypothetical protein